MLCFATATLALSAVLMPVSMLLPLVLPLMLPLSEVTHLPAFELGRQSIQTLHRLLYFSLIHLVEI